MEQLRMKHVMKQRNETWKPSQNNKQQWTSHVVMVVKDKVTKKMGGRTDTIRFEVKMRKARR